MTSVKAAAASTATDEGPISGYTPTGEYVRTVTIESPKGTRAQILTLGARLHDLVLSDGTSVVLSYADLQSVVNDTAYINTAVGRVANRIADGNISDVSEVPLPLNDSGINTLHGGLSSWDRRLFAVQSDPQANSLSRVTLVMYSMHGDNGFPSTVKVSVVYEFVNEQTLNVSLITENIGSQPTFTNMTLHTYFDLTGNNGTKADSVLNCQVHAPSSTSYLPKTNFNVPTGAIESTSKTAYDFTCARTIGSEFEKDPDFPGYDNFLIASTPTSSSDTDSLPLLVSLLAPSSKWGVHVRSNQPGFQMYTPGGFAEGLPFARLGSVAIEPSEYIDAPNHPNFPSILLGVNGHREQVIQYEFFQSSSL